MKEKVCGIYKITNKINGMSYVGQSKNCMERWSQHKNAHREMHISHVKQWHPDWILIEEDL